MICTDRQREGTAVPLSHFTHSVSLILRIRQSHLQLSTHLSSCLGSLFTLSIEAGQKSEPRLFQALRLNYSASVSLLAWLVSPHSRSDSSFSRYSATASAPPFASRSSYASSVRSKTPSCQYFSWAARARAARNFGFMAGITAAGISPGVMSNRRHHL